VAVCRSYADALARPTTDAEHRYFRYFREALRRSPAAQARPSNGAAAIRPRNYFCPPVLLNHQRRECP
jgi:hypothetical protein